MARKILAIYPHPDDETFVGAGTLIQHTQAGDSVTLVCATLGQMGRRMGKPFFATRESLPHLREKELRDACKVIGIADLRLWKMQDKMLQFKDEGYLAQKVLEVFDDVHPEVVYTFYPGHGVHPDHDALSAAVVRAVTLLPETQRPVMRCKAVTINSRQVLGDPAMEVDVSNVIQEKISALKAHKSQTEFILTHLEEQIKAEPGNAARLLAPYAKETYWIYDTSGKTVS
ncbi:bacillithiol biosynthesis deacetylase BshB2 [Virgibacillus sp. 179-BFC.A HS]|uniref:Bacillithiol biosynthesis deacetylase BshB2 n=1 Tax=Tigheibacillus jepli TaxID=3035914 RepID=A0ABU5CF36_9BACI|nr:bacillithiol biosynthesis deacetylase BshB2 [Virgibacillus sp. 179-BFC.A HS]MDY0404946.1 bacillithiol biosynthesis deacetylase BshB2 [Virgibacillus sp. 179-BFC.A HS]